MNSNTISIWASPTKKSPSKNTSPLKELLKQVELEGARNALNSQKKQDDYMTRKVYVSQNNEDALLSSRLARIAQAAQRNHLASQDAQSILERREYLEHQSFDLWKDIPTEPQRIVLNAEYPE